MSDIAKELRERSLRAEQEGEPLALLDEAADEIARLRLTDEERLALLHAEEAAAGMIYVYADDRPAFDISEKLRGLRERLG